MVALGVLFLSHLPPDNLLYGQVSVPPMRRGVFRGATVPSPNPNLSPGDLAAEVDDPKIQAAIDRARSFLRTHGFGGGNGSTLVALALLKAGDSIDSETVAKGVKLVLGRVTDGIYTPTSDHFYSAGVDLMLLEAADPADNIWTAAKYLSQMEAIVRYIIHGQLDNGSWYYPDKQGRGDTSITQYALLGLWAAVRADIDVPSRVWDSAAKWLVATQLKDGSFTYHPFESAGSTIRAYTMTAAAVGSLHIARMQLFPNQPAVDITSNIRDIESSISIEKKRQLQYWRKFRFLVPIDLDKLDAAKPKEKQSSGKPKPILEGIDKSITRGIGWLSANWRLGNNGRHLHYYFYALERMAALSDVGIVGEHYWYTEVSNFLLSTQNHDGSWNSQNGKAVDTSFCVMCLTRATANMLNRRKPRGRFGAGLLAGGRGLADDLSLVTVKDGKVKARKLQGPLDELLNGLENPQSLQVESLQSAVLERVQLGNREELIGQKERLARLTKDPRPEVRRIALWALARSGDFRNAPLLIAALQDADLDVVVEARNGLCTLSRKPRGLGSADHPYVGLPEDAAESKRSKALARWQTDVRQKWRKWYLTVRPYDERNDLWGNTKK